ncbi:hypothetical protein D9611_008366 [Ephemerocybe angulata]|uniref:Uncharacterized protein n=1 Tax=Ephemerocybe angulata TaxID=980116 RepID=A0A8H5BIZ3_9AGAR|nr:hypothetical protein D9611_008366 [Tulosesus angulatus]
MVMDELLPTASPQCSTPAPNHRAHGPVDYAEDTVAPTNEWLSVRLKAHRHRSGHLESEGLPRYLYHEGLDLDCIASKVNSRHRFILRLFLRVLHYDPDIRIGLNPPPALYSPQRCK